MISIHALLAESDAAGVFLCYLDNIISIHALLAESDAALSQVVSPKLYFYPRSPCGERHMGVTVLGIQHNFYPRSPCGERPCTTTITICTVLFLSTLSLRRATKYVYVWYTILVNFYPRSPCGERLSERVPLAESTSISIHALLAESDKTRSKRYNRNIAFLSTLSLRRATPRWQAQDQKDTISIHALLAESDFGRAFWPGLSL